MVINKIKRLCDASKFILICNHEGEQWIGTGRALYLLHDMPRLNEETVCAVLDIAKDKRGKYQTKESVGIPGGISTEDNDSNEKPLQLMSVDVSWNGRRLTPAEDDSRILFLDREYLAPFKDLSDGVQLYTRTAPSGRIYIAAKDGMFLRGIIQPEDADCAKLGELLRDVGQYVMDHSRDSDEED